MLLTASVLPRSVALVRITKGRETLVLVAPGLSHDQELAARVFAAILAVDGQPFVMLLKRDVMAAMTAAA